MLYYHKCDDCLTPFSSTEKKIDLCDCMGKVTYMGIVHGDKYTQTANKAPCDGRCTHAMGPVCDCGCGGVNHGTGRTVTTVVKEGKVQVVDPSKDIYDDMVRGYKFRELRDKAEDIFAKVFGHLPRWGVSPEEREARAARVELNKAVGLRVYDRRQKSIMDFIFKYAPRVQDKNEQA